MKKRIVSTLFLVVLLVSVFAVASAQTVYPEPGSTDSNAIIQNTATGAGQVATLSITYYAENGSVAYTNNSVQIDPKAVKEVKTEDEPLPGGFSGSAQISSDMAIAAVTSLRNREVPAGDGWTQAAYNGLSQASNRIFFPTYWGFSGIVSRMTVQNTDANPVNINVHFYDRSGNALGTLNDSLPGFGSKTYCACDPADWPNGVDPETFVDGAVTVETADDSSVLAGASMATWQTRAGAYQALTPADRGTVLYAPAQFRFKLNAGDTVPTLFSALNIQNTSTTTAAEVTIEYYNRDTGALDLSLDTTIQPLSAIGANTNNGGSFAAGDFAPLGWDWDGSAKIISTNNVELVGTGITNWGTTEKSGMYILSSDTNAASELFLPAQYRRTFQGSWAQWSSLNLQNIGTATVNAADLTIQYIDQNGNVVETFSGADLPGNLAPGAAVGLNTRNGGDLAAGDFVGFGESFIGGIYVSAPAGSELVATANILYANRASVYNAASGQ